MLHFIYIKEEKYMSFIRRLTSFALVQMVIEVAAAVAFVALLSFLLNAFPATFINSTFGTAIANVLYACAIFCVLFLASRRLEHRSLTEIGLPGQHWLRPLLLGFLSGGGLMTSVIFVLALTGCYHITSIAPINVFRIIVILAVSGILTLLYLKSKGKRKIGFFHYLLFVCLGFGFLPVLASLIINLTGAIQEELVFRGIIFRHLERVLSPWPAVILSALLFGAAHLANPGATLVSSLAIAITAGVIMAAIYLLTRSLWWAIGLHLGWNFFEGPISGAQVSGHSSEVLIHASITGPQALTGGAFGPEAGWISILIVGTIGILLCILATRQHRAALRDQ
jgi:membrane protease YdiL (CAAX protease family)